MFDALSVSTRKSFKLGEVYSWSTRRQLFTSLFFGTFINPCEKLFCALLHVDEPFFVDATN